MLPLSNSKLNYILYIIHLCAVLYLFILLLIRMDLLHVIDLRDNRCEWIKYQLFIPHYYHHLNRIAVILTMQILHSTRSVDDTHLRPVFFYKTPEGENELYFRIILLLKDAVCNCIIAF